MLQYFPLSLAPHISPFPVFGTEIGVQPPPWTHDHPLRGSSAPVVPLPLSHTLSGICSPLMDLSCFFPAVTYTPLLLLCLLHPSPTPAPLPNYDPLLLPHPLPFSLVFSQASPRTPVPGFLHHPGSSPVVPPPCSFPASLCLGLPPPRSFPPPSSALLLPLLRSSSLSHVLLTRSALVFLSPT